MRNKREKVEKASIKNHKGTKQTSDQMHEYTKRVGKQKVQFEKRNEPGKKETKLD